MTPPPKNRLLWEGANERRRHHGEAAELRERLAAVGGRPVSVVCPLEDNGPMKLIQFHALADLPPRRAPAGEQAVSA